jgi:CBS domain-containing protein
MPTVAELMSLHADRVPPEATLAEAAALMVGAKISSVIVVDRDQAIGIVTEGDMLHAMRQHRDPLAADHHDHDCAGPYGCG